MDRTDKFEVIEGKGVFVNGKKIDAVTDWSIKPDSYGYVVLLELHVTDVKLTAKDTRTP